MRRITALLIIPVFAFVLFLQVRSIQAVVEPITGPITSPIGSPSGSPTFTPSATPVVTPSATPVSTPSSTPIPTASVIPSASPTVSPSPSLETFNVSGNVSYRLLGRFLDFLHSMTPAKNVLITLTDFFNPSVTFTTMTDVSGNFYLTVTPGLYWVKAANPANTFFVPPITVVNPIGNHPLIFQGLIFPGQSLP